MTHFGAWAINAFVQDAIGDALAFDALERRSVRMDAAAQEGARWCAPGLDKRGFCRLEAVGGQSRAHVRS